MKVHLGCGQHRIEGWVNVDLYKDADIQSDIRTVNFPLGSVSVVRCIHTIEHIQRDDAVALMHRVADWLEPGGIFEIETPDRKKCLRLIESGETLAGVKGLTGGRSSDKPGWHQWIVEHCAEIVSAPDSLIIPAEWDIPGERHWYVWTANELATELVAAGFSRALIENPQEHAKRKRRDCRVVGIR